MSSSYLTSLLHLHISSATNGKIIVSTDHAVYNKNYVSEFEDMIAAYESLLSVLPIFSPSEASDADADAEAFSLFFYDMSMINILVEPTTHRITRIVDWECVSLKPLSAVPRVPELLEGPEVLQIPDPAPPPIKGAKEPEKSSTCFYDAFFTMR